MNTPEVHAALIVEITRTGELQWSAAGKTELITKEHFQVARDILQCVGALAEVRLSGSPGIHVHTIVVESVGLIVRLAAENRNTLQDMASLQAGSLSTRQTAELKSTFARHQLAIIDDGYQLTEKVAL